MSFIIRNCCVVLSSFFKYSIVILSHRSLCACNLLLVIVGNLAVCVIHKSLTDFRRFHLFTPTVHGCGVKGDFLYLISAHLET